MKKETLYCDICGKEIERTDEVQMSIRIEKKSLIWDELGGYNSEKCELKDLCPDCIHKLYNSFKSLGLKFNTKIEGRIRY
jgi:hypothetical protein